MLVMHHADTAGALYLEALVDPSDDAAVAMHDIAGGLGRVERAGRSRAPRRRRRRAASLALTAVTSGVSVGSGGVVEAPT